MCIPLAPIWIAISSFLSSIFTWFNQFDTIDSALFLVSFPPYCWGCSFFGYLPLIPLPWSHSILNTLLERFSSLIHCPGLIYNSSKSALCVQCLLNPRSVFSVANGTPLCAVSRAPEGQQQRDLPVLFSPLTFTLQLVAQSCRFFLQYLRNHPLLLPPFGSTASYLSLLAFLPLT